MKKLVCGVAYAFLLWGVLSTVDVAIHNSDADYTYSKANLYEVLDRFAPTITTYEQPCLVVSCEMGKDGLFEVVVRDINGNEYAYWDDNKQEPNDILDVVFAIDDGALRIEGVN